MAEETLQGEVAETPKYTLIEYEGRTARLYKDGSIREENGNWITQPTKAIATRFTSETASEMGKRRKQKILEAVEQGVMKATDAPNPYEAIAHLVEVRARVAMEDLGRAGNDAAKMVLEALDAKQDKTQETVQTQRMEYVLDPETREFLERLAQLKRENG